MMQVRNLFTLAGKTNHGFSQKSINIEISLYFYICIHKVHVSTAYTKLKAFILSFKKKYLLIVKTDI